MSNWKGTAVPNNEYVEKIYINKNLTPQEVEKVLSKLSFEKSVLTGTYIISEWHLDSDTSTGLAIMDVSLIYPEEGISGYIISKGLTGDTIYYISNQDVLEGVNVVFGTNYDFVGWNPNVDDFLEVNSLTSDTTSIQEYQNDKLSSLFSITPFEEANYETVEELLTDVADAIREKKGIKKEVKWIGTEVPNSGTVEKVYVNTNLSVEEVRKLILNNVKNELDNSKVFVSYFIAGESHAYLLAIIDSANRKFHLLGNDGAVIYVSVENPDTDFVGWNPNFNGQITINSDLVSTIGLYNVGTFNSSLSSLISLTPFEKKTGLIPAKELAKEIRSIEGGSSSKPTAVPISGMIDKVYFNFNVDVEKMCNIVKDLTYLQVSGIGKAYPIISNEDMSQGLMIQRIDEESFSLIYVNSNGAYRIASFINFEEADDPTDNIYLWDDIDISQPIEFGFENAVELAGSKYPTYVNSNELLKEMISITPIQKFENVVDEVDFEINGIIKQYQVLAGENISAGDFVETINNSFSKLFHMGNGCYEPPSCVLLEKNKVFIAHANDVNHYLYGTIVTFDGTTMTATSQELFSYDYGSRFAPSCVLLENNKVFIAHSSNYSSALSLFGTIVTINGTTMTHNTAQLDANQYSCRAAPSCILLENNKVFIAHPYGDNYYLYGTIVTIDGTTMTATSVQLNSDSKSCYNRQPSCILLEKNKVFITHPYGN